MTMVKQNDMGETQPARMDCVEPLRPPKRSFCEIETEASTPSAADGEPIEGKVSRGSFEQPSVTHGAGYSPVTLGFAIAQGHSADTTSLRANDRTARMVIETTCSTEEEASRLATLFKGEGGDSEDEWARLHFELLYASGEPVEMQLHTRHADHIDVMEPSGATNTRRMISDSKFAADSRSQRAKRQAGGEQRPTRTFVAGKNLEITYHGGTSITLKLKFSTNVTSRQHDRKNFVWRVTLSAQQGDSSLHASADTNAFEYVASGIKQKPASRAKKKPAEATRVSGASVHDEETASEDEDAREPIPIEPEARITRSTRKAAAACRKALPQFVGEADEAAGPAHTALKIDDDHENFVPPTAVTPVAMVTPRTEDRDHDKELMSYDRNRTMVDFINMLFKDECTHGDLLYEMEVVGMDLMSEWAKTQAEQMPPNTTNMSRQLSRCISENEVYEALGMEGTNSSSPLLLLPAEEDTDAVGKEAAAD